MRIAVLATARNRHTHLWCRWLADHGHEVGLFSDTAPREDMDYSGIMLAQPEWTFFRNLLAFKIDRGELATSRHKWRAWSRPLLAFEPDILHAHHAVQYGPTLAHFPQFARVLTPWGTDMESLGGAARGMKQRLVIKSCQAADVISTNGPGLESRWAAISGLAEDRFRLFSWGVDRKVFHRRTAAEMTAVRESLGLGDGPFLLSPRLANSNYRIVEMVEGWKKAGRAAALENFVILRAGARDEDWARVQSAVRGVDSIKLVERYFAQAELAALYSAAAAVAMMPESDLLAMSLLEAMSCGAPLILARLPAYEAVISNAFLGIMDSSGAAYFLESMDAAGFSAGIERYRALSPALLGAVRENNLAWIAANEDRERCLARIEDVYALALERARARTAR